MRSCNARVYLQLSVLHNDYFSGQVGKGGIPLVLSAILLSYGGFVTYRPGLLAVGAHGVVIVTLRLDH